jgi:hypothetical protein
VLRVSRVIRRTLANRLIRDAERHDTSRPGRRGESSNRWVINIQDQNRPLRRRDRLNRGAPPLTNGVNFAITVKLIAKQVRHNQDTRMGQGKDTRDCCLVGFKNRNGPIRRVQLAARTCVGHEGRQQSAREV